MPTRRTPTLRLPAGSLRLHLLQAPIRTTTRTRAEASRWTWAGVPTEEVRTLSGSVIRTYGDTAVLTPLSILHTLTGLTIHVTPRKDPA